MSAHIASQYIILVEHLPFYSSIRIDTISTKYSQLINKFDVMLTNIAGGIPQKALATLNTDIGSSENDSHCDVGRVEREGKTIAWKRLVPIENVGDKSKQGD
ncbi:MAG: hypothetical protein ACREOO_02870 [bacterium]